MCILLNIIYWRFKTFASSETLSNDSSDHRGKEWYNNIITNWIVLCGSDHIYSQLHVIQNLNTTPPFFSLCKLGFLPVPYTVLMFCSLWLGNRMLLYFSLFKFIAPFPFLQKIGRAQKALQWESKLHTMLTCKWLKNCFFPPMALLLLFSFKTKLPFPWPLYECFLSIF